MTVVLRQEALINICACVFGEVIMNVVALLLCYSLSTKDRLQLGVTASNSIEA